LVLNEKIDEDDSQNSSSLLPVPKKPDDQSANQKFANAK